MKPTANEYDFTVIGRWRNRDNVVKIVETIRDAGRTCYSFTDNDYDLTHHDSYKFSAENDNSIEESMRSIESLPVDSPIMKEIFERDIKGLKNARAIVLALPGGTASFIESGIAFGLGKKLYAVGEFDKAETLFQIFDKIFTNIDEFKEFLKEEN